MRLGKVLILLAALATVAGYLGTACSRVSLKLVEQQTQLSLGINEVCAAAPIPSDVPIKILFLVDASGSNCTQNDVPPNCDSSGTDPEKSYRLGLIENFITDHRASTNLSYSIVTFQKTAAMSLTGDVFTRSDKDLAYAYETFKKQKDTGATPYRAAITLASDIIRADKAIATEPAKYFVVMLSDGMPTDYGDPISEAEMDTDIKNLRTLSPDATISAIYYNQLNVYEDARILTRVAMQGGGGFSNTNVQGKQVPLEEIMALTNKSPYLITQMFVSNLNAAPCDDGTMDADSDADGICDKDEIRYNKLFLKDPLQAARMGPSRFNPQNRNSFPNSFNDLFNYRRIQFGQNLDEDCTLPGTPNGNDADHDLLNVCEEQFITSNTAIGPNELWTGAMKNIADPFNFDSDGDGVLDWLEFAFSRIPSTAMDYSSLEDQVQGYTMGQILAEHRNPIAPAMARPYDGNLKFSRVNSQGRNCYSFDQKVMPLYDTLSFGPSPAAPQLAHGAHENVILIYFVEKPENELNGPGVLRYFYQTVNTSVEHVTFNLDLSQYGTYSPDRSRIRAAITDKMGSSK